MLWPTTPLLPVSQVVRTRLTADNIGRYSGVADTFGRIIQYEGVRGLYRGLLPSVAAIIPEAAITCAEPFCSHTIEAMTRKL